MSKLTRRHNLRKSRKGCVKSLKLKYAKRAKTQKNILRYRHKRRNIRGSGSSRRGFKKPSLSLMRSILSHLPEYLKTPKQKRKEADVERGKKLIREAEEKYEMRKSGKDLKFNAEVNALINEYIQKHRQEKDFERRLKELKDYIREQDIEGKKSFEERLADMHRYIEEELSRQK